MFMPEDCAVGRSLMNVAGQLEPEETITATFCDVFAPKSTATLVKRSSDFYALAEWIVKQGCRPLSFSEKELYAYLQVLRQAGAAPTKADSTLQAVRFVIGILGASMQVSLVVSSRCKGAARAMFETKAPLRQAIPLRAEQVWKLEKLVAWSTDKHLLCVCGFLLFCIYSSSRIGDATRLEKVSFSKAGPVHLVEAQSLLHKGGNTQQRRTKFLPLMALGSCLDVRPWAVTWAVARKEAGLEDSKFLMPALAEHSKSWLRRRMTTAEATQYLRELLVEAGEDFDEAEQVTGHSCKATIPTWVGRHGQFSLDERRLLTHHMDKNNEMVLTYSRDSLTALHTKVYKVLQLIKSAEFNPDAKPAEAIRQEEDLFADPSEPVTRIRNPANPKSEKGTPAIPTVMHIHSGVMHIAGSDGALKCGRGMSKNLVPASVKQNELADYNVCKQCLATH
ncbi:unnamed protein product [Effrenium voratum]|nr:unnamed protein product [Effrenium voratum]